MNIDEVVLRPIALGDAEDLWLLCVEHARFEQTTVARVPNTHHHNGTVTEAKGVDVFEITADGVLLKDAYRRGLAP
jgi:hypothetical protein